MTAIETTEHWSFYPLLSQAGSDVLDKNNSIILDNDTNIRVLQMLYDMIYTYKIAIPMPGGFSHSEEWYGFMNGGGAGGGEVQPPDLRAGEPLCESHARILDGEGTAGNQLELLLAGRHPLRAQGGPLFGMGTERAGNPW